MRFGVFLASLGILLGIALATLVVALISVRGHFDEIPLSRSRAVALSSLVATTFAVGWLTLGIFGFAIGQSLGNQSLGSFIGGLVGIACWVFTTVAYGWRITRGLAELQLGRPSLPPAGDRQTRWLRIGSGVIFVVLVLVVAGVAFAAISRTASP